MNISGIQIDVKSNNQESDLFIYEECGDGVRPNILYDSHKTNNDIEYLNSLGIYISDTGVITKIELG